LPVQRSRISGPNFKFEETVAVTGCGRIVDDRGKPLIGGVLSLVIAFAHPFSCPDRDLHFAPTYTILLTSETITDLFEPFNPHSIVVVTVDVRLNRSISLLVAFPIAELYFCLCHPYTACNLPDRELTRRSAVPLDIAPEADVDSQAHSKTESPHNSF
jgi:hypothetical protein